MPPPWSRTPPIWQSPAKRPDALGPGTGVPSFETTMIRQGVRTVLKFLLHRVVGKLAALPVRRRLAEFEAATHHPQRVQEALLRDLVSAQVGTAFGRDHRFDTIRTAADFAASSPSPATTTSSPTWPAFVGARPLHCFPTPKSTCSP